VWTECEFDRQFGWKLYALVAVILVIEKLLDCLQEKKEER
jgi:hypothetical protein